MVIQSGMPLDWKVGYCILHQYLIFWLKPLKTFKTFSFDKTMQRYLLLLGHKFTLNIICNHGKNCFLWSLLCWDIDCFSRRSLKVFWYRNSSASRFFGLPRNCIHYNEMTMYPGFCSAFTCNFWCYTYYWCFFLLVWIDELVMFALNMER